MSRLVTLSGELALAALVLPALELALVLWALDRAPLAQPALSGRPQSFVSRLLEALLPGLIILTTHDSANKLQPPSLPTVPAPPHGPT